MRAFFPMIAALVGIVAVVVGLGAALYGAPTWLAVVVGVSMFVVAFALATHRERRRRALAKAPFPARWRETLVRYVGF